MNGFQAVNFTSSGIDGSLSWTSPKGYSPLNVHFEKRGNPSNPARHTRYMTRVCREWDCAGRDLKNEEILQIPPGTIPLPADPGHISCVAETAPQRAW